ncbi:MAG: hypothetical protein Q8R20_02965, partial [Nanoarchaeota archaeon]|nr:hypothetical protein [Nanoarchaeota archaeon]
TRLEELKKQSAEGTLDAVIIGGNYTKNDPFYEKNYLDSIRLLEQEVQSELGFNPVVMTGPKIVRHGERESHDDIYYDNEKRRLYIMRPEVGNASTESFLPSDLEKQKEKWNA